MKRFFLAITMALLLISYSNAVSAQENAEVPVAEAPVTESAGQPEVSVVPEVPVEKMEEEGIIVLIDDALPEGSTTEGTWGWDTFLKESGEKSHTEPPAKGVTEHSYRAKSVVIPKNYVIEQYVYLDPENIPKGIMLKFRFENDGKEDEIGIYREGEEEVFIFSNDEPMLYDGTLPNAGKWEKLEIYCDDLGLAGAKLTGMSFVTYGGRAYWDFTRMRAVKEGEQYPAE